MSDVICLTPPARGRRRAAQQGVSARIFQLPRATKDTAANDEAQMPVADAQTRPVGSRLTDAPPAKACAKTQEAANALAQGARRGTILGLAFVVYEEKNGEQTYSTWATGECTRDITETMRSLAILQSELRRGDLAEVTS